MNRNPFGTGYLRDEDGIEMDDWYCLFRCTNFSANNWTRTIARGSYGKQFELLCPDADKCAEMKYNWNRFRRHIAGSVRAAHKANHENRVANILRSMYSFLMAFKKNVEDCAIGSVHKQVCDDILCDIDRSSQGLLACMSYCRVAVPATTTIEKTNI